MPTLLTSLPRSQQHPTEHPRRQMQKLLLQHHACCRSPYRPSRPSLQRRPAAEPSQRATHPSTRTGACGTTEGRSRQGLQSGAEPGPEPQRRRCHRHCLLRLQGQRGRRRRVRSTQRPSQPPGLRCGMRPPPKRGLQPLWRQQERPSCSGWRWRPLPKRRGPARLRATACAHKTRETPAAGPSPPRRRTAERQTPSPRPPRAGGESRGRERRRMCTLR
jgi:hypothetical protein